jgi:phytoene synthase
MRDEALRVCYETIAVHSKSFALASRLLPREVRDRAVVVYAWCRRADDAIDLSPRREATALLALRSELDEVYGDRALTDPVLSAFQWVVHQCAIPRAYADELLAGMEMDVEGFRYDSMVPLELYCYRVAGTVGLMMCHVMGIRDERATRNAAHLGMAMQITNICRDVAEDWSRERLYLPESLLAECGIDALSSSLGGPFPEAARPAVSRAIGRLLHEADRYYASGDAGLGALSWRCALAIRTARRVYAEIGTRIRRADCDPLAGRAIVPIREKLGLTLGALMQSLGDLPRQVIGSRRGTRVGPPQHVVTFPEDILPV